MWVIFTCLHTSMNAFAISGVASRALTNMSCAARVFPAAASCLPFSRLILLLLHLTAYVRLELMPATMQK
jgi:hypothetical protein